MERLAQLRSIVRSNRQLISFGIIGVTSNIILYLLYITLTSAGLGPKTAASISYAIGVTQSFLLNRRITFKHEGAALPVAIRFAVAYAIGYLINILWLYAFVDIGGYPHEWAQLLLIPILAMTLFLIQKFWVFKT